MRLRALLLVSVVLAVVLAGSFVHLATAGIEPGTGAPPLATIKDRVQKAYNYILRLKRDFGTYAVISSYPGIPVVVYNPADNAWWVPGVDYPLGNGDFYSVKLESLGVTAQSTYTEYRWVMKLYYSLLTEWGVADTLFGELRVTEHREPGNSFVRIDVTGVYTAIGDSKIYVGGVYVGTLQRGATYYRYLADTEALPSMRTAFRHEDVFGSMVFKALGSVALSDVDTFSDVVQDYVLGFHDYDIYSPMLTDIGDTGIMSTPCSLHFYDGKWFDYGLGYYRIWESFESRGWVWRSYPSYPYKSKIVAAAETSHLDGGDLYIEGSERYNDPLYYGWWGLYYANKGMWTDALAIWGEYFATKWDGVGIVTEFSDTYSTVRLAVGLALGSILARNGWVSWDIVDEMAYVLVYHLQWGDWGYYTPDKGTTVYRIYKPDHAGGFMVAYIRDSSGRYVFAEFRPGLLEEISDLILSATRMDPEYGGPIPTNAETTIVAMAALMQYAYSRYGVPPTQLLG